MADTLSLAVDKLKRKHREELYLKLLTYAGPPPTEGGYTDWCGVVENGIALLYPSWGQVDMLDATIQYRHWCNKRGIKQRRNERLASLFSAIFNLGRKPTL